MSLYVIVGTYPNDRPWITSDRAFETVEAAKERIEEYLARPLVRDAEVAYRVYELTKVTEEEP